MSKSRWQKVVKQPNHLCFRLVMSILSNVEGRNGYLSLRNHQLRGLELPRKRACLTTIHNFFLVRPDGTTAAERFFGQKPRSLFAAILDAVDLPPAPRSPQRRF